MKEDITNSPRFQRILLEAAEYRLLRDIFKSADRRLTDAKHADKQPYDYKPTQR
jgi:hypothetical protein